MRRNFPDGYRPMSFCRSCGRDFAGDTYFDRHRVGSHEYDWSPEREDGRRCLDDDELRAKDLRPMTDEEMRATKAHRHRAGFGVEMWFDPVKALQARSADYASAETPSGSRSAPATDSVRRSAALPDVFRRKLQHLLDDP